MKTTSFTSLRILATAATLALQPLAAPASPSDLLEKGIYSEETKGDLDAAIAIYEQLIAEAKANQSLAAQAQLRLGQCYLKKNRTAEANAAFEKLIRDFPNEKEIVAKAREYLPAEIVLGPVPWVDGERLKLNLTLAAGMDIGALETRADLVESSGRKVWRVGRRMSGGGEMLSTVDVVPETFHPLASYWKHTLLGEATGVFRSGEVEIQKTGSTDPIKIHPDKVVFDNEECFHLLRRLPLQVGYKTTVSVVTTLGGGTMIPLGLEVPKKEMLETPAGKFDCFKLVLNIGQTLWISDDAHRYFVKFEGGGAIGLLASITQRQPGTPVAFRDDTLGVSFTAPADWLVHRFGKEQSGKLVLIRTFDAAADATDGGLRLFATDSLPAAARQSARAWAESEVGHNKEVKVRPDSWKNINVAGRLGATCLADFTEDGKPRVQSLTYVLGPKWSEFFVISSAPESFEALKAAFDTIIATYRMTK